MIAYAVLLAYSLTAILLFFVLPEARLIILYVSVLYYLVWAGFYYGSKRMLTLSVMLEYVLIALMAMIALQIAFSL